MAAPRTVVYSGSWLCGMEARREDQTEVACTDDGAVMASKAHSNGPPKQRR